jgi:probable F420-dependent oxidoreductase
MRPDELARLVEDLGLESLLFAEHTHIPPDPERRGRPAGYTHTYDLFVALTAAAAATTRLRIGSGICLVVQRDPIVTAKEVASIDQLSGGRFEFGVGAGWVRQEMANHGTDPRTRMALLHERVDAMKAIWTQDEASYHGAFVDFDRIWCSPKPAQRPHPPILVGGTGPTVLDRVLAFGDAWIPDHRDFEPARAVELLARAERPVEVQVITAPSDPRVFQELADVGVTRVLTWLPATGRAEVEAALEGWVAAIARWGGTP